MILFRFARWAFEEYGNNVNMVNVHGRSLRGSFQKSEARLMTKRSSAEGSCKTSPKDSKYPDKIGIGSALALVRLQGWTDPNFVSLCTTSEIKSLLACDWSMCFNHAIWLVQSISGCHRCRRKTEYKNPVALSMNFFMYWSCFRWKSLNKDVYIILWNVHSEGRRQKIGKNWKSFALLTFHQNHQEPLNF